MTTKKVVYVKNIGVAIAQNFKPIQAGLVATPRKAQSAAASDPLDVKQSYAAIGDIIPIVFARFRDSKGGILVSPSATEARYENTVIGLVTVHYHLVISEGQISSIPVKDVLQGPCRVGTFSQNYNVRAGTWVPGNFMILQVGTQPEVPYYGGSVGAYPNLSTLSFSYATYNDNWRRQVHLFIRGGVNVTRIYDGLFGPSDNFVDLVVYLFNRSQRLPSQMIDTAAMLKAATFLEYNKFRCNCNIKEVSNLGDFLAKWAPLFLLCVTSLNGKYALRPLLPTLVDGSINTGVVVDEYTFTEDIILLESLQIQYISLADRQPFVAQMIWRQQFESDIGIPRTSEVKYAGTANEGPYETFDLSEFCTNEDHAMKVGTYILARRIYSTHTISFTARPQAHNAILASGSIIRVRLNREATNYVAKAHDYFYQVTRIVKTLTGEVSYEAIHFPVDAQGRSMIALDVAAATGSGVLMPNYRSGLSCNVNSAQDNTIPPSTSSPADTPSTDSGVYELDPSGSGNGFTDSTPTAALKVIDDNIDSAYQAFPSTNTQTGSVLELAAEPNTTTSWSFGSDAQGWQPFTYGVIKDGRAAVIGSAETTVYPNGDYTIRAVRTNTQTGATSIYQQYIPPNAGALPGLDNWRWTAAGGQYVTRSYYPQYPYRIDRILENDGIQRYDVKAIVTGLGGPPLLVGPFRADEGDMRVTGAYDVDGNRLVSYI